MLSEMDKKKSKLSFQISSKATICTGSQVPLFYMEPVSTNNLNGLMKEQNNTNAASRIVTRILDYEHNYDAENEIMNKRWFVCEKWSYKFRRWNEEEPLLKRRCANTQKRKFTDKFSLTAALVFVVFDIIISTAHFEYQEIRDLDILEIKAYWAPKYTFCIIVGFNLFFKISESIHHRLKSFVQVIKSLTLPFKFFVDIICFFI